MSLQGSRILPNGSSKEIANMTRSKTEVLEQHFGISVPVLPGVQGVWIVSRAC